MSNHPWLTLVQKQKAIAVIRASNLEIGRQMALAVASGGMQLIEITWNSANAAELIARLRLELPGCLIGTGTLLSVQHLHQAISAGAQFLFTPHVDRDMIQVALEHNLPIIPGALSPTEIVSAWNYGATCVKVFPVQAVGGAKYIKSLQGPLGHIPLIPTGGVTLVNAREFLQAGAIAVGLSGELFPKQSIEAGDWQAISRQAKTLMDSLGV
jgi:2-dehydro-3-deoxyphosphogluconate aldolase / (4S)-4-hydroxy-2-oxoglutarate aldolase